MDHMIASTLLAAFLLQAPPATEPAHPTSDTASLIAKLSDPDTTVRDAAQEALLNADQSAIELMKSARDASSDPDVQLRLDALIVRSSESEAVGASRITLRFQDAPLNTVLNEFAKQSKAAFADPVQTFGNELPRITIDVENVTFWQALTALRTAGNLTISPQANGWQVTRNFGNNLFGGNAVEAGAFLIQPMMANYARSITYNNNGNTGESFMVMFQMIAEPKIRLAQAAGQFRLIKAIDSKGNNLAGPTAIQTFGIGQNLFQISTQLVYPKQPGETIVELSGAVKLNIARNVETLLIEDFGPSSKQLERMIEGSKVSIAPGEPNAGQPNWINVVVVIEPQGDPTLLNRLQATLRQIRVSDSAGRVLQMNQFQASSVNAQRGEYRLSFMPIGNAPNSGPYKLLFEIPTSYREVEVPFTVRDLKMP
jgi:hypothetical protein